MGAGPAVGVELLDRPDEPLWAQPSGGFEIIVGKSDFPAGWLQQAVSIAREIGVS